MARKLVFSGTGTRGDLLPMLAMAAEMQRRGHDCHVLGNDGVAGLAERLGVPFTPIAPAQTNNLTSVEVAFDNYVFASYEPTFDLVRREVERGTELVIVNPESYAASTLMAERYGLPLCRFTLAPYRMFSLEAPHWPWSEQLTGRFAHTFRRYTLPRLYARRYTNPYILSGMNRFRKTLGLAPIDDLRALAGSITHQICLFPEWYCPRASDWPRALDCVGFPLEEPSGELPDAVARWIEREGAPLVFTPGTGVVDVKQFFDAAQRCCELLQRPGLFLSPNLEPGRFASCRAILCLDYLELALVLPRAALLVHHGGIGTTARALEASTPQLISPQAYDQPDNGHRISELGAGAMLSRAKLSGEALADVARRLLESDATRRVLSALGQRVRDTKAIAAAADILERRFLGAGLRGRQLVPSAPQPFNTGNDHERPSNLR